MEVWDSFEEKDAVAHDDVEVGRETGSIIDQSRDATGGSGKVEEQGEKAVLRTRLKGRTMSKLIPSKTELVSEVEELLMRLDKIDDHLGGVRKTLDQRRIQLEGVMYRDRDGGRGGHGHQDGVREGSHVRAEIMKNESALETQKLKQGQAESSSNVAKIEKRRKSYKQVKPSPVCGYRCSYI